MRKMWKKLIGTIFLCMMLMSTIVIEATENEFYETESSQVITTEAEETSEVSEGFVYDYAALLSEDEISALEMQIMAMQENTGWDIFAVTTDDAEGKSAMEYADDFYDERTADDSDGILVLIDMDNREIYVSTCGTAIRYLTDTRIEHVLDDGYYHVSDGEYANCLSAMPDTAEYYYEEGIGEDQYNYDVETGAISEYRTLTWMEVVPVFFVSVIVGLAIFFGVKKSYNMKGGRYEYPYMKYGKLDLTSHEDRFIRQHVTHHRIQTESSSGGGGSSSGRSSTHRSSSGRSHGGGGRKF